MFIKKIFFFLSVRASDILLFSLLETTLSTF